MALRLATPALLLALTGCDNPTPPPPAPAATPPLTNTLRWSTASEDEVFGFDIYRSTSASGPFARLTPQPIAGAGTKDTHSDYVYLDDTIAPATPYFYSIETIKMDGTRRRLTGVIEAVPKQLTRGDGR